MATDALGKLPSCPGQWACPARPRPGRLAERIGVRTARGGISGSGYPKGIRAGRGGGIQEEQNRCASGRDCGFISPLTSNVSASWTGAVQFPGGDLCDGAAEWNHGIMAREQLQVFYTGRVQGVGFRATVKRVAHGYDVTGVIRNLPDGRVELVAEGDPPELEAFRQGIRDSGLGRFIRQEDARQTAALNEFRGFEIVR